MAFNRHTSSFWCFSAPNKYAKTKSVLGFNSPPSMFEHTFNGIRDYHFITYFVDKKQAFYICMQMRFENVLFEKAQATPLYLKYL
jgi:hypothetical protein